MKILHYFLGFPPYRSGGLTAYCMEIMESQRKKGDVVLALWPGRFLCYTDKVAIKRRKEEKGICSYELINPLPVPLDEGILNCDMYMKDCPSEVYEKFLCEIKPDVIHIHTLMGLHKEFISSANLLGIKTIFTSHDYFGLCSKVTFFKEGKVCSDGQDCSNCIKCNQTALSLNKIKILQSPLYKMLKDSWLIKKIRKQHRREFHGNEKLPIVKISDTEKKKIGEKYKELRAYYVHMLANVDEIHFNSTVARDVYMQFLKPKKSRVISITRKDIFDNRDIKHIDSDVLRITYLAPAQPYKGFNVIVKALDELWYEKKINFKLQLFSPVENNKPYMCNKNDGFKRDELKDIFANTDILIAPSICKETFGFTVLEALSYGVPVIVSDNVGAKDIIGDAGIVVRAGDSEQIKNIVKSLDREKIEQLRDAVKELEIKSMKKHMEECYEMYLGEIN